MSHQQQPLLRAKHGEDDPTNRRSSGRLLERGVSYVLWALAACCLVLVALVWWRLLSW